MLVRGLMVADLLERGDRGEDLPLARCLAFGELGTGDELVEHGLVEPDLPGCHCAVVELVDLVGELFGDLRFGLGASEHEDAVQRAHRVLGLDARGAAVTRETRDELRSVADEPGVDEVEDGPEVAEAVLEAPVSASRNAQGCAAAVARCRWPGS